IEKYDKDFEHLKTLRMSIQAEPVYKEAMDAYRRGEKGKAINLFLEVDKIYPDYRETTQRINELKSGSQVVLTMMPLENQTREEALGLELNNLIEMEMYKLQNPLLKVFSSNSLNYPRDPSGKFPDDKTLI